MTLRDDRSPPPDPRLLVLIVEDEPILRMAAIHMVEEAGYVAVEARDAIEAVLILEARPDIGIVFTDIEMPGALDGGGLAVAIRDRWPPIEIILTSSDIRPAAEPMPDCTIFLSKPYTEEQLARLLAATASSMQH